MKRIRGAITHWNRRKAYGFITPDTESEEVFVHISEFNDRSEMPAMEQVVEFTLSTDKQGRICATEVVKLDGSESEGTAGSKSVRWMVAAVVVLAVAGAALMFFLN